MKQPIRHCLMIVLLAATIVSCKSKAPREAKYIPREASIVLAVDLEQLQDKLTKGGISMDTLLKRVFKNDSMDAREKAHFTDLKDNAGIKWNEKLFLFAVQKTNADNSQSNTFNVIGSLADAAKLEAFLKKQDFLKDKEIKKEKDYSYIVEGDNVIVAWNAEQIIASFYNYTAKPVYDTITMQFKKPDTANTMADRKKMVDRFFTQKTNESLADVEIFTNMFKEKADGYAFTSGNSALSTISMMPLQIPKLEELLKDNYTASTLDFGEGKIVAKTTSYTNELLSSVLKKYAGPTVDLSLITHYPSDNINGVMLAAFNPEIFGGILKQLEVEGLANNFLEKAGFTTQDLYKSLKGDIAVVVSDVGLTPADPINKTNERNMMRKKPLGKMVLNAPVGDKASFLKIMDKAVEMGVLTKKDKVYKGAGLISLVGLYVQADEKNLTIASDSLTYVQYMQGTGKAAISKEVLDRLQGKSTVFYVDIAKTINGFVNDADGSYNSSLKSAKATFKDMFAFSDNFDGKSVKAGFEVRMQNEKQNSFVTLTSLVTDIAVDMRLKAKREREAEDKLFPGGVPAIIRTN